MSQSAELVARVTRQVCLEMKAFLDRISFLALVVALSWPTPSSAAPDAVITYVDQFGSRGTAAGEFRLPTDIDSTGDGILVITENVNGRLQRCNTSGQCEIVSFLTTPNNSVIDDDGNVIVAAASNVIKSCDHTGNCSTLFGSGGSGLGQFNDPHGIDIDSQGRLVIADRLNHRVQFCDYEGECTAFGTFNSSPSAMPGEFWEPFSILTDRKGGIYVGEIGNEEISVCDESGSCWARLWTPLESGGTGVGEFAAPTGLAFTSRGDVLVSDLRNDRIQLCDLTSAAPETACIVFGESGSGEGQFDNPYAAYIDQSDRAYIVEGNNHRVQVVQITYKSPPPQAPFQINQGINDAWFDPQTAGQGFFIVVYPDIPMMFLSWFTYEVERPPENIEAILGEPGHRWLTAQGPFEGDTATLDVVVTRGSVFDSGEPVPENSIEGTMEVIFDSCTEGLVKYDIPALALMSEVPIERITADNVALCQTLAGE